MALTDISKIVSTVAPPDDEIRQSWFFTLMGRATATVVLIFGYLAALGLIYNLLGEDLRNLHGAHPLIFYGAIFGPLVLVTVFSVIPTVRRALRERRLYPLATREGATVEGYFRLRPYEEADADAYSRPDGALTQVLGWLRAAPQSVLYLSGASGAGKTSLVNAGVIPALRADGWQIVTVRGMGDPLRALTDALYAAPELFLTPPDADQTALDLLRAVGEAAERSGTGPVLIVLDQFEEYLILDSASDTHKTAYGDMLRAVAAAPVAGVHLLHVFREDYQALLFKEDLPDFRAHETGFAIAPFNRREAEAFLRGGPQQLEQAGYDALFAGLDRIEDARGIYRPITLNMVGYVLDREGTELSIEPRRLIEQFLREVIFKGEAQDFSAGILGVLKSMEPKSVSEIEKLTGFAEWQIKSTLSILEGKHVIKSSSDEYWSISHEFIARTIEKILQRSRRGWLAYNVSPVVGFAIVGWALALAISLPAWQQMRMIEAQNEIARIPTVEKLPDEMGGQSYRLTEDATDDHLSRFVNSAEILSVSKLVLYYSRISNIDVLSRLELKFLEIERVIDLDDLKPISDLPISELVLYQAHGLSDVSSISRMPLKALSIVYSRGIRDIAGIAELNLESLDLTGSVVSDLSPLSGMPLRHLKLAHNRNLSDLSPIHGLPIQTLDLSNLDGVSDLSPLKGMPLKSLNISYSSGIKDLSAVKGAPLTRLDITGAYGIDDLGPLKGIDPSVIIGASDDLLETLK